MSHHLIIGAGPVGSATARLLLGRGDDVTLVTRSGSGLGPAGGSSPVPGSTGVDASGAADVATGTGTLTVRAADASDARLMADLAQGAAAIHNCANPAYHRWATDWPPIAASLLGAAERSGAVLTTVSNLYGYGPVDGELHEDLPLAAPGAKGRTRAQMWERALAAHQAGRARVTEVRGSDYLCAGPGSHMGDRVTPFVLRGKNVSVLKSADMPHTWTSVDDVARLLLAVAADERAWGRPWHVPSNEPRTQREVVADLCAAAGVDPVTVREHAPVLMRALGLVNPLIREFHEVAYQFERPFVMDSTAAQSAFGLTPTPWPDALAGLVAAYRRPALVS